MIRATDGFQRISPGAGLLQRFQPAIEDLLCGRIVLREPTVDRPGPLSMLYRSGCALLQSNSGLYELRCSNPPYEHGYSGTPQRRRYRQAALIMAAFAYDAATPDRKMPRPLTR
jgi:hypothetical protein